MNKILGLIKFCVIGFLRSVFSAEFSEFFTGHKPINHYFLFHLSCHFGPVFNPDLPESKAGSNEYFRPTPRPHM